MPELPDLEVFSHNLNKLFKNKKLEKIEAPVTRKLNVSEAQLKKTLEGQTVKKIEREGKELFIHFSKGDILSLHLMLHGNLYLFEKKNENKHTQLALYFKDENGLALTDWQNMAVATLNPDLKTAPDALSINYTILKKILDNRRAIKTVLLDQKLIRGIGNAYADEILWEAGISPFSTSNKIPDEYVKKLVHAIKKVLKEAQQKIKAKDPDIITGEVRDFLNIHNAKKKQSPTGAKIVFKISGSRKTYYTDEQKLFQG